MRRSREALALSVIITMGVVPLREARAETPSQGDTCAIAKPVKAATKAKGPKKTKVAKGKTIVVGPTVDDVVEVSLGKQKLYFDSASLSAVCKITKRAVPVESPAVPATKGSDVALAPLTPPPQATTPAAAGGFGDTTKTKVAVMDLTATASLPKDLVASLSGVVAESLDGTGAFKAISSQDIVKLLSYEAQKQQLGCDDMSCLAEIGGALGADYLVTGSLTQSGSKVVVQMQLANIQASRVDNRVSRDFEGNLSGLFDEVRTATKILVRDLLAKRSGGLTVTVNEEGATIKIDGSAIGVSPMPTVEVAGGVHNLTVEKEGFVTYKADVSIEEGRTLAQNAHMLPSEDFVKKYESHAGLVRSLSWVGLAAGVVGLGGGGVLWYLGDRETKTLNKKVATYNADVRRTTTAREDLDKRERKIAIMDMGTLGGAALGVAGIATWIALRAVGDDPDRYKSASAHITVSENAPMAPASPNVVVTFGPGVLGLAGEF